MYRFLLENPMALEDITIKLPDYDPSINPVDPDKFLSWPAEHQNTFVAEAIGWVRYEWEEESKPGDPNAVWKISNDSWVIPVCLYAPPDFNVDEYESHLTKYGSCPNFMSDKNHLELVKQAFCKGGNLLTIYSCNDFYEVEAFDDDADPCAWGPISSTVSENIAVCLTLLYAQGLLTRHPHVNPGATPNAS
jgi:hypothetical protein